jgi:predicted MFS family arabinose efflux permease
VVQAVISRARFGPGAVLFTCLFAAQAALLVLSPILPQVADEFGVSNATAAQLRSVSGITAGVVALVLATIGNRFRLPELLNLGLLLLAVGSLASGLAPSFLLLLLAQVVIGLGLAAVLSGGLAASETWAVDGDSARVLSWALIGQPVAWIVGQPLVGLVSGGDWRWAWVAVPFASAVVALGAMAVRNRVVPDAGQECDPLGLWKQPGVKGWAVAELLAFAAWAGTLIYVGALFIESYATSVGVTGLLLGLGAVFYLPGNSVGRRLLGRRPAILLIGFSLAAGVAVLALGTMRSGLALSLVVFSISVFFAAGRTIAGAAIGLELSDGRRLAAMSVRTATVQFGYLLGAALGGVLLANWGFAGVGWGFGLLFALSAVLHVPRVRSGERLESAVRFLRRRQPVTES